MKDLIEGLNKITTKSDIKLIELTRDALIKYIKQTGKPIGEIEIRSILNPFIEMMKGTL